MKHKYKIKIDPPVPTDEQIAGHKDFGRILADYHNLTQPIYRVPLYKNPKAFMGLVLIMVIAGLVFWEVEREEKELKTQSQTTELPAEIQQAAQNSFRKAPTPTLALPMVPVIIQGDKPQVIALDGGLTLTFPEKPFATADGQPYSGDALVQIRQLHTLPELIAIGIPMQVGGQAISTTRLLEIAAHPAANDRSTPLQIAKDQSITVEVKVPDDALQARQLFRLDLQKQAWLPASPAPLHPQERKENRASMNANDGFGVVEYDVNGQVIPKPKPGTPSAAAPIHVLQFDLKQLGIICLGETQGQLPGTNTHKVRFTDASGQALRLLTLYGITQGRNTVDFLWPKTADCAFDLQVAPQAKQGFVGFLPDGRIASIQNIPALPSTETVQVLQMQVSAAPVKNLQELTQLIDGMAGL